LNNKHLYQQYYEPSPLNPGKLDPLIRPLMEPSLEEVLNESYNDDNFLQETPKNHPQTELKQR